MNLLAGFVETANAHSKRVALVEGERAVSYEELLARVRSLASLLNQRYADQPLIGIAMNRGIDAVCAIFAVVHAGKCYLPLDLKNPPVRLQSIVHDSGLSVCVGAGDKPPWFNESLQWVDLRKLKASQPPNAAPAEVQAESLACILYTSGSTGAPKGVALSHRALTNFIVWSARTFAVSDRDRIASLAPFHFDLSIFDLFCGLGCGAEIHLVPDHLTLSPSRLTDWLDQRCITIWYTVPSLLNFVVAKGDLRMRRLQSLKKLLFAGEVMPAPTLIKLSQLLPDTRFYNLFGPTETNVCCYWPVEPVRLDPDLPIPIGQAACNMKLGISEHSGELLVSGENLFSGYWRNGRIVEAVDPNSWYASGDYVSQGCDGTFYYHGRIDRMLKCSGFRVEPAEIETVLCAIPEVVDCAVVGIKDPTSGQRPAAALVLRAGTRLRDVIESIKASLPGYMQPVKFLLLDQLPLLSNGKTDYLAISEEIARTYSPPPLEKRD